MSIMSIICTLPPAPLRRLRALRALKSHTSPVLLAAGGSTKEGVRIRPGPTTLESRATSETFRRPIWPTEAPFSVGSAAPGLFSLPQMLT
jgi:hypothetical protein